MSTKTKSKSKKVKSSKAKKQVALPTRKQPQVNSNKLMVPRNLQLAPAMHKVCGLTDPFCMHAMGAKFPDNSSVRTLPFSFKGVHTITTNAGGYAGLMFNPSYKFQPICLPVALDAGGLAVNWHESLVFAPITGVMGYRIVSAGFRLKHMCTPLTASGIVRVRSWQSTYTNSYSALTLGSYNCSNHADIPLQDLKDFAAIITRTAQMPQTFYNVIDDINILEARRLNGFNPISIFVTGAPPNTTVIDLEYVVNYELVFDEDTGLQQAATPPPPANSLITNAAAKVTSSIPAFFSQGASMMANYIEKKAISALSGYLFGPTGGAATTAVALLVD